MVKPLSSVLDPPPILTQKADPARRAAWPSGQVAGSASGLPQNLPAGQMVHSVTLP
jgi:hypothetical protein